MRDRASVNPTPIRGLCAQWREAVAANAQNAAVSDVEKYALHRNGFQFHELDPDELWEATEALTLNLLHAGRRAVYSLDHLLLWSWLGELLAAEIGHLAPSPDFDIEPIASMALRCSMVGLHGRDDASMRKADASFASLDVSSREVVSCAPFMLPYLAFPLLEAVVRRACPEYLDQQGRVQRDFMGLSGRPYKAGVRCSSIADELKVLVDNVASPTLETTLVRILEHIAGTWENEPRGLVAGLQTIGDWRNTSLHGEASFRTIGGTVLSLALLIVLDGAQPRMKRLQELARARAQSSHEYWLANPDWFVPRWVYYPPFVGAPIGWK